MGRRTVKDKLENAGYKRAGRVAKGGECSKHGVPKYKRRYNHESNGTSIVCRESSAAKSRTGNVYNMWCLIKKRNPKKVLDSDRSLVSLLLRHGGGTPADA